MFDYGGVTRQTTYSTNNEANIAGRNGISFLQMMSTPDALIERSRSRALGVFMDRTDDDVLLMIDRDMNIKQAGDAIRICQAAWEIKSVVGGIYCKKAFGDGWAGAQLLEGRIAIGDEASSLEPAHYVATGMMAIPRSAIERCLPMVAKIDGDLGVVPIEEPYVDGRSLIYYDWFKTYRLKCEKAWVIVPEDKAFCDRLRNVGDTVYIDPRYVFGHIGDFEYLPGHGTGK